MVKIFYTFFVLIVIFFTTFVRLSIAESNISLDSFQIKPEINIEITAQSMIFNSETNITEFFTNVNVRYGQLTLSAEKLTVSQLTGLENYSKLTFFASGPVVINNEKISIRGDQATFSEKNKEIEVLGNVSLLQESTTIFCDRLVLNLKEGIAKISGSVKTIITPAGKTLK